MRAGVCTRARVVRVCVQFRMIFLCASYTIVYVRILSIRKWVLGFVRVSSIARQGYTDTHVSMTMNLSLERIDKASHLLASPTFSWANLFNTRLVCVWKNRKNTRCKRTELPIKLILDPAKFDHGLQAPTLLLHARCVRLEPFGPDQVGVILINASHSSHSFNKTQVFSRVQ